MSNPALHPDRREITTYPAMIADWSVRTLVPCVLVAAGLTDDAADLAQLPEITPVSFQWPGLLERASRIVTGAGAVLLEMFLAEHQGRPGALPPTYQVLREGLGPEVLDAADDARIAVLPHQIGQHAYYTATVGVQLLHLRHGAHSGEIRRLRDAAQVSFLDLQQDVAQWQLSHPADVGLPAELPPVRGRHGRCRCGHLRNAGSVPDGHRAGRDRRRVGGGVCAAVGGRGPGVGR